MVRGAGFEPATPTVSRWCSTTELTALLFAAGRSVVCTGGSWQSFFSGIFLLCRSKRLEKSSAGCCRRFWEIEDGKTAKACSRFGHERSEVARRAEGAGGSPESTWEMVSHEGTKARRHEGGKMGDRRWGGILNFGFWILNGEMEVGRAGGGFS